MVIMVAPLEDAQHLTPQDDHLHQEAEAQFCSLKFMSFAFRFLNHPTGINWTCCFVNCVSFVSAF
jgi:hypothetical protein